jgi:zinc protease
VSGAVLDRALPPSPGELRPFSFPEFERHELEPGLIVYSARRRRAPLVFLELILPAGAAFDPSTGAGVAALAAGMLDEGTEERSSLEIAAAAERLGGYLGTSTDWNVSSISTGLVSQHLEAGLGLLGEVLSRPTFPEQEIDRLRDRTLAELRRRRVVPSSLAARQYARALFGDAPYGRSVLGTRASVEGLTRAEIESFYRSHLTSAPVALIAAGDFELDRLHSATRRLLAGLPRADPTPYPEVAAVDPEGTRVFLVDRPGGMQTELRIGHMGVARSHPDFLTLAIMNSLLGGKFTSRLNLNLRERHGFTYGVRSSFARRLAPGPFTISTAVGTETTGQAIAEARSELVRLREESVTAAELSETVSYILGVFPYTVQSLEGVSNRLRELAIHSLPDAYWDGYAEAVGGVTVAEVERVAREHLDPERLTVVAVGPEKELRGQLEEFGEVVVWRPSEREEPV